MRASLPKISLLFSCLLWSVPPLSAEEPGLATPTPEGVIVVTGARRGELQKEAVVKTDVLTREDIKASGAMNVSELLAAQPGVEILSSFRGEGARIRGMDPDYVLILVDGERVNGRLDGTLDLTRLTLEDVERVEIIKGAASALYGSNAMGGVINIITRPPEAGVQGDFLLSYGSFGSADVRGGSSFAGAKGGGRGTAEYHAGDGWDLDPSDEATTGSAFRQGSGRISGHRNIEGRGVLRGQGEYLIRQAEGVDVSGTGAVFDRRNLTEFGSAGLGLDLLPGENTHIKAQASVSVFRDQYLVDQRGSDALDSYEETLDKLLQGDVQGDWALGGGHILTAGGEVMVESIQTPRVLEGEARRLRGALYTQGEFKARGGRLAVVPGVRLDGDSQFGVFSSPKLAGRWALNEELQLRASLGRGYKAPDFKELYLTFENPGAGYRVEGNPDLRPEQSTQGDVSITWSRGRVGAEGGVFSTALSNMIAVDTLAEGSGGADELDRYSYINIAHAWLRGAEAGITLDLNQGLSTRLSYLYLRTLDQSTGLALEGRAPHQGTALLRWTHQPWGFSAQVRGSVFAQRPFYLYESETDSTVEAIAPAYGLLDARLSQAIGGRISAFVSGQNLLNSGDGLFLPIQPRLFRLGVEGTF